MMVQLFCVHPFFDSDIITPVERVQSLYCLGALLN